MKHYILEKADPPKFVGINVQDHQPLRTPGVSGRSDPKFALNPDIKSKPHYVSGSFSKPLPRRGAEESISEGRKDPIQWQPKPPYPMTSIDPGTGKIEKVGKFQPQGRPLFGYDEKGQPTNKPPKRLARLVSNDDKFSGYMDGWLDSYGSSDAYSGREESDVISGLDRLHKVHGYKWGEPDAPAEGVDYFPRNEIKRFTSGTHAFSPKNFPWAYQDRYDVKPDSATYDAWAQKYPMAARSLGLSNRGKEWLKHHKLGKFSPEVAVQPVRVQKSVDDILYLEAEAVLKAL